VPALFVAAGGGGDAITASVIAARLQPAALAAVLTYSWDRLLVDPLPGPRNATDFDKLVLLAPSVLEVTADSRAKSPAGSTLPRLADGLPTRLLLLDPTGGAVAMTEQVERAATVFGADEVVLVDVGGDVLASGGEPGLRSPLADQLALAAVVASHVTGRVLVVGPGVDGELGEAASLARIDELGGRRITTLEPSDLQQVRRVFAWHPSEASGLVAAAGEGVRGTVQVRDAGDLVRLTDYTAGVYEVDLDKLAAVTPATALRDTTTLADASELTRHLTGITELDIENAKATARAQLRDHHPTSGDLDLIDQHAAVALSRGADYVSVRNLAESVGAITQDSFDTLRTLLTRERPAHCRRLLPIYSTKPVQ
jgi:hypothetical protein